MFVYLFIFLFLIIAVKCFPTREVRDETFGGCDEVGLLLPHLKADYDSNILSQPKVFYSSYTIAICQWLHFLIY